MSWGQVSLAPVQLRRPFGAQVASLRSPILRRMLLYSAFDFRALRALGLEEIGFDLAAMASDLSRYSVMAARNKLLIEESARLPRSTIFAHICWYKWASIRSIRGVSRRKVTLIALLPPSVTFPALFAIPHPQQYGDSLAHEPATRTYTDPHWLREEEFCPPRTGHLRGCALPPHQDGKTEHHPSEPGLWSA